MKNTAGDAKRRGRKVPKSVRQQYKWINKQKKETEVWVSRKLVGTGVKFSNVKGEKFLIDDASQIGSKEFDFPA